MQDEQPTIIRVAKRMQIAGLAVGLVPPLVGGVVDVLFYREAMFWFVAAGLSCGLLGLCVGVLGLIVEAIGRSQS